MLGFCPICVKLPVYWYCVFSAALCGTALADEDEIEEFLWQKIKGTVAFVLKIHFSQFTKGI